MTFEEKIKSDTECLQRVLKELMERNCDQKSIAIVLGILQACKDMGEN